MKPLSRFLTPLLFAVYIPSICSQAIAASIPIAPLPAGPVKQVTTGAYHDSGGGIHHWSITQSHMLIWDNDPYLPVGGAFMPRYWVEGQTDANWKADVKALETIKANHVQDLYLYAGTKGLTKVPTPAFQKLIDYLDTNGFHYGLEIADFPKFPLTGYVIKPTVYRNPSPHAGIVKFSHISGLSSALYFLTLPSSDVVESGVAKTGRQDTALVTIKDAGGENILLLYPERMFFDDTSEGRLPAVWQSYDRYRDKLLVYFSKVSFGKGLRFFIDPLVDKIGINGDAEYLVPTTDGFRMEFQNWLVLKYKHNLADLNTAWAIQEQDLPSFETAARCIPLWSQSHGLPDMYDPVDGKQYPVLNKPRILGRFWDDFKEFRSESVRGYMNKIADVLKSSVADVPVIYKWSGYSALFHNDKEEGGYDGLGMEAYGHGHNLVTASAGYTLAQSEESPKTNWLIVSGTSDTASLAEKTDQGYTSKAVLFNDWDYLKDVSSRGFFTTALQRLPESEFAAANLAAMPDQLGWLGSYAASLQASSSSLNQSPPQILWYPSNLSGLGIGVRQLKNGTWWLPSSAQGDLYNLGLDLKVYILPNTHDVHPSYIVWSPNGALAEARFTLEHGTKLVVTDLDGNVLKAKNKGDSWIIPVGAEPVLITGLKSLPLPDDAVDAISKRIAKSIIFAKSQHIVTQQYEDDFFHAMNYLPHAVDHTQVRYPHLVQLLDQLTALTQTYTWIEGESSDSNNFDAVVSVPDASNGACLLLDTAEKAGHTGEEDVQDDYHAAYHFNIHAPSRYTLWMAASPDGSPFTYSIDGGLAHKGDFTMAEGSPYAGKFVWLRLGDITLQSGAHTLRISLTGRHDTDNHYAFAIDAFCIDRAPFTPDGPNQPQDSEGR